VSKLTDMFRKYYPRRLLGRRGLILLGLSILGSFILSIVEYGIALFLVVFLCSLGFIDPTRLPSWWPFPSTAFASWAAWLAMLAVGLLQAGARILMYQSKILLAERLNARFKMLLGYIILKQENLRAMPLSRIDFYMSECFPKATAFVFFAVQTGTFCIEAMMMTAGMIYLAWGEALVGIAGMALIGGLVIQINRFTNRIARRIPEAGASLERTKLRISRNWILIKILRIQEPELAKLLDAVFRYYRHSVLAFFFGNFGSAFMPVVGIVVIALMVTAHFRLFHTPATGFVAFLYLYVRLQQKLANGSNLVGGMFTCRVQFLESLKMFNALSPAELQEALRPEEHFKLRNTSLPDLRSTPRSSGSGRPPVHSVGTRPPSIHVRNVTFQWPGSEITVFRGVEVEIAGGSQFGIVGPNGSGKSTLLGIMIGIYEPGAGDVLIGDVPAKQYITEHPGDISYVGPEPYLVYGSIRENLLYGLADEPTDAKIRAALRTVRLDEFVQTLPEGMGYVIQEDGAGLSSGQKQRLTIARAFLRKPLLLILDEPSANLDEETEAAVVDTLHEIKGRCTVVIVSHKPGILRGVDRLLDLGATGAKA